MRTMNRLTIALAMIGSLSVLGAIAASAATRHKHAYRAMPSASACAGEYMYRQDGKCVDARNKGSKTWGDTMMSRSTW
jgi:hypothetical protein